MKITKFRLLLFFVFVFSVSIGVYFAIQELTKEKPTNEMKLCIQPLGNVPKEFIRMAKDTLKAYYGLKVTVLPAIPMPKKAFYPKTGRYRADTLLNFLAALNPKEYDRILALTEYSISTTKGQYEDWGILGLAQLGGHSCVVSNFIMKSKPSKLNHRWVTVVLHEMGHTFGLSHCETSTPCLMKNAKGTVLTIDKQPATLCALCKEKLL